MFKFVYTLSKYIGMKLHINRRTAMNTLSIIVALDSALFTVSALVFMIGRLFRHQFTFGIAWTLAISGLVYIFGYSLDVAITYPSDKKVKPTKKQKNDSNKDDK